nr:hypothetical protein [Tanacetum cinerariifolium]
MNLDRFRRASIVADEITFGIDRSIKDGKVIVVPTDTLYGFACDADGLRESVSHLPILTDSTILILVLSSFTEVRLRVSVGIWISSNVGCDCGIRHGELITIFSAVVKATLDELSALWLSCSWICDALAEVLANMFRYSFRDGLRESVSHLPILTDSTILILVLSSFTEVRLRVMVYGEVWIEFGVKRWVKDMRVWVSVGIWISSNVGCDCGIRHGELITIFSVVVKVTLDELSALWLSCSWICDALAVRQRRLFLFLFRLYSD